MINSTKVNSLKVVKFGSMDIVESHGDILQPGGQLETPGLVSSHIDLSDLLFIYFCSSDQSNLKEGNLIMGIG